MNEPEGIVKSLSVGPTAYSKWLLYQKSIHAETKPKRPGVPQGGTLESAAAAAKELAAPIYED